MQPFALVRQSSRSPSPRGFTIVELLVVISIVAVLVSLALPAMSSARENTRGIQCSANQRSLTMAYLVYLNEYKQVIPLRASLGLAGNVDQALFFATVGNIPNSTVTQQSPNWYGTWPFPWNTGLTHKPDMIKCPSVRNKVPTLLEPIDYSYNAYWAAAGGYADGHKWETIPKPASYPYFFDTALEDRGNLGTPQSNWFSNYGDNEVTQSPAQYLGVGPVHGSATGLTIGSTTYHFSTSANVMFSDGHLRNVNISEIVGVGSLWFKADGGQ